MLHENTKSRQIKSTRFRGLLNLFSISDQKLMDVSGVKKSTIRAWKNGRALPLNLKPLAEMIDCKEDKLEGYLKLGNPSLHHLNPTANDANCLIYDKMVILSAVYLNLSIREITPNHIASLSKSPLEEVKYWRVRYIDRQYIERFCHSVGVNEIHFLNTPIYQVQNLIDKNRCGGASSEDNSAPGYNEREQIAS